LLKILVVFSLVALAKAARCGKTRDMEAEIEKPKKSS
jgi:hypothetical protein